MLTHSPGQGAIYHKGIGNAGIDDVSVAVANVEVAMNRAPRSSVHNKGRRGFLARAGIGLSLVLPGIASAKIFAEEEMDGVDRHKLIKEMIQKDGGDEMSLGEFNKENQPRVAELIKEYIDKIVARSDKSKLGVHMQRHENAMWLIKYFNDIKKTDKRVLYYPAKVGINSKFVVDFLKENKAKQIESKVEKIEDPNSDGSTRKIDVYLREGEKLVQISKPRAVLAFVDTGWAYVILPANTHIIINGNQKFIAACRNSITLVLSECADAK